MSDQPVFRVLVTSGGFEPGFRGGGPIRSVARIIDSAPRTVDVTLVTSDRDLGDSAPYPGLSGRFVRRGSSRVFYLKTGSWGQWIRLWRELRSTHFDLLYANSVWSPIFTLVPIIAVRSGLIRARALAIAPRGELSPGALSLKAAKKRIFLRWCHHLIGSETIWHASAAREADEIRTQLPHADVLVNSDQASIPPDALEPTPNSGPARLVFIGRISRKKNIALLLTALTGMSGSLELDIYGPIEDHAYWRDCESLMADLPPAVRVRYRGELAHGDVRRTFARYDAFAFPTLGENFGHVIAESLSAACPVVCSDTTPWTGTLEAGGGRVVQHLTAADWRRELERLAGMSPLERLRARTEAAAAYRTWSRTYVRGNFLEAVRIKVTP